MTVRRLLPLSTALFSLAVLAEEQAATMPSATDPEFFSGAYLIQVFFSLLLVIGLMFGVLWGLRRFNGVSRGVGSQLQVLASVGLGQREKAVLLAAGDRQILIGVAPGEVRTLHVFDEPIQPPVSEPGTEKSEVTFGEVWKQAMGKRGDQS